MELRLEIDRMTVMLSPTEKEIWRQAASQATSTPELFDPTCTLAIPRASLLLNTTHVEELQLCMGSRSDTL
jgi:hypothetical protein